MTAIPALTSAPLFRRLRQFFWLRPDWWTIALCGASWWAVLLHVRQHSAHGVHHRMTLSQDLQNWMLMVAAMMLPLILDAVRHTAFASLWSRRHRAIAGFLLGYSVPWLLLGIAVALLHGEAWTHTDAASAAAFLLAAAWQLTPIHESALRACHRTLSLAPFGWLADRDCLRFGCSIGLACAASCWALMLACTFTGHSLLAMTGGLALGIAERWSFRPRTRVVLGGTLLLAGYYALLTGLNHVG